MKLSFKLRASSLLVFVAFLAVLNVSNAKPTGSSSSGADSEKLFDETKALNIQASDFLTTLNAVPSVTGDLVYGWAIKAMNGYFGQGKDFMSELETAREEGVFEVVNELANLTASIGHIYQAALKHKQEIPQALKTKMTAVKATYGAIPLHSGMKAYLPEAPAAGTQASVYGKKTFAAILTNYLKLLVTQGIAMMDHCKLMQEIGWVDTFDDSDDDESSAASNTSANSTTSAASTTSAPSTTSAASSNTDASSAATDSTATDDLSSELFHFVAYAKLNDTDIKIFKDEFEASAKDIAKWTTQIQNPTDKFLWELMQYQPETFRVFSKAMDTISEHGCHYDNADSGLAYTSEIYSGFTEYLSNYTNYLPTASPAGIQTCSKSPSGKSILDKLTDLVNKLTETFGETKTFKSKETDTATSSQGANSEDESALTDEQFKEGVAIFLGKINIDLKDIKREDGPALKTENIKCIAYWNVVSKAMGIISETGRIFFVGLNKTTPINWDEDKYTSLKNAYNALKTEYEKITYTPEMSSKLMEYPSGKSKTDAMEFEYKRYLSYAMQHLRQFINALSTVKSFLATAKQSGFPALPTKLQQFETDKATWDNYLTQTLTREQFKEYIDKLRDIEKEIQDLVNMDYMDQVTEYARTHDIRLAYYDIVEETGFSFTRFMTEVVFIEDTKKIEEAV